MTRLFLHISLLLLSLCFIVTSSNAQLPHEVNSEKKEELFFRHLTRDDGLPSLIANCVISDPWGYIWIGTENGLVRYDGKNMRLFQNIPKDTTCIVNSSVRILYLSRDSMIWAGTANGFSVFDPLKEKFFNYQNDPIDSTSFPANYVFQFWEDKDGMIWIGTNNGLIRFDKSINRFWHFPLGDPEHQYQRIASLNNIHGIDEDPRDSSKLLVGAGGGLVQVDKTTGSVLKDYNQVGMDYSTDHVEYRKKGKPFYGTTFLYVDGDSAVWTGSWNTDLKRFDLRTEEWDVFSYKEDIHLHVIRVSPKNKDELWVATAWNGLGVFNKHTKKFRFYKHDEKNSRSLLNNDIRGYFYFDADHNLWAIHWDMGISIVDPNYKSFTRFVIPSKISRALSFLRDDENEKFYVAGYSANGLLQWDMKKHQWNEIQFLNLKFLIDKWGRHIYATKVIQDKKGIIWVGTRDGLYYYDGKNKFLQAFALNDSLFHEAPNRIINDLFEDSRGCLWIGTHNQGVKWISKNRKEIQQFKHHIQKRSSLKNSKEYRTIIEDRFGRIWIGCYNGINIYDPIIGEFLNILDDSLSQMGINGQMIKGMALDTMNRLFISISNAGILRVVEKEKGIFDLKLYHLQHGLNDLNVGNMELGSDGNIWVINEGLLRFNPYAENFRFFDTRNGLHSHHSSGSGNIKMYFDQENNLFLPSYRGYETVNLNNIKDEIGIINVLPESMEINGKQIFSGLELLEQNHLILKPGQNNVSFTYTSICLNDVDQVIYQYELQGYNEEPILAGKSQEARYTNLPPGDYTFRVNAAHRGNWSDKEKSISFTILPFFWQTWWFWLLFALFIIAVFYSLYRYRLYQMRKEEKIKSQFQKRLVEMEMQALRAQMNPHFVFNSLNSINNFILKNETEPASDYLTKFSRLVRQVLYNSKMKLVSLDEEFNALRLYIELEQLRFYGKFDFEINVAKTINTETTQMPPLLFQAFVENAIWHGLMHKESKGHLWINARKEEDKIVFEIIDDGIGRKKSEAYKSKYQTHKKSMGMSISKDRIGLLNKMYNLETEIFITDLREGDVENCGTKVVVKIPEIRQASF
jgi:ligand-binding sensor domain-containing protein